ncbi:MAG: transposase, partial [Pseudomonadota bacterium]
MVDVTTAQGALFNTGFGKPLTARFDHPHSSSDGGAILLKASDRKLGLIEALALCVRDDRCQERVRHGLRELIEQRVYG